jgi:hypothetical protein
MEQAQQDVRFPFAEGERQSSDERQRIAGQISSDGFVAYPPEGVLELRLDTDPDGYWGGVQRDWRFAVNPPRIVYDGPLFMFARKCDGESTNWVKRHMNKWVRGLIVHPRHVLTATSKDGERVLTFTMNGLQSETHHPSQKNAPPAAEEPEEEPTTFDLTFDVAGFIEDPEEPDETKEEAQ